MKLKKIFSIFLCSILIISFSSCRKKDQVAQTSKPSTEKVELKFWNLFDDTEVFKGQIQAYQSKHPNVKISYKKFTNIDEYEELLINEIAEGEGPDIFAIKNNWTSKHKKKIQPFPIGKTTIPMNKQIFEDTFFHTASEDLIHNGQIYGIPLFIDTLALYYNKQIFRDNIPNSDKPGETWEDIKSQSTQITKENNSIERFSISGIAMGRPDNIHRANDILYSLMLQQNTPIFSDTGKSIVAAQNGVIEGTGQSYVPFLEALKLYSSFGNPSYKNYSWNDAITSRSKDAKELNPFLRGKVGMVFGYSYLYDDLISMRRQMKTVGESVINESDIGVIEFPQLLSFEETGTRDALAMYYPLTVSRNSKNADYAWDFIQFLTSKESLIDYHEQTHKPSSRKDLVDEQMIDPIYGVFARQASYSKSFPQKPIVDPSFLDQVFIYAMEEAISNKKQLIDVVRKTQDRINCQIEKEEKFGEVQVDCLSI